MQQSKLIVHLKALSRPELNRLRDFVHSPYYNKHPKVRALMDLLFELHPDFKAEPLDRKKVFKKLFPKQKFEEQKLSHLMNYLLKLMEQFLATEAFEADDFLREYLAVQELKTKVPGKIYERKLQQMLKNLDKNDQHSADYFLYKGKAEAELDEFYINRKKRTKANFLQKKSDSLDHFFLATKLQYYCDMLNRSNVLNIEYDYPLLDALLQLIASNQEKYLGIPLISIYYRILKTLYEPDAEQHFSALKNNLLQFSSEFPHQEAKAMYDYAQNYCIKRINQGDSKYLRELLDLYQLMLEKELKGAVSTF
ncbi:MAG: hypothetical protein WD048_06530 [Chitinophagales bacterium]